MHPQDRLFCEIAVRLNLLTREQVARCMKKQQSEEAGKNIATLAVALGFMNQSAVESVVQQQQRLLDRRREARNASEALREAESRAAAGLPMKPARRPDTAGNLPGSRTPSQPDRPGAKSPEGSRWAPSGPPSEPGNDSSRPALRPSAPHPPLAQDLLGAVRGRSSTPNAARVYAEEQAAHVRRTDARADDEDEAELLEELEDDSAIRETLDERPGGARAGGRKLPGPPEAPAAVSTVDRSSLATQAPAARRTTPAQPAQPVRGARLSPNGAQRMAAGRSSATNVPARAPSPAGRANTTSDEPRSPRFVGAATSGPVPPPPPSGPTSARGTWLDTSGREAQRDLLANFGDAQMPALQRPVPSGRDWRNPSRPPPPGEGLATALQSFGSRLPHNAVPLLESAPDGPGYIARALERCAESGASDLLLHVGALPHVRIDGSLQRWTTQPDQQPLAAEVLERVLSEVLDEAQLLQLSVDGELRCVYQTPDNALRARVHAYSSELGLNAVFRLLPREVPSAESLGLQAALRSLRDFPRGLCICSGPAGSGKTTTLAAIAQHLATQRALHVVSLESPLELQASGGLGLFEQREIGRHVSGYVEGIEWAVGQAADVIVVADLLVPGALAASLHASRTGCLVLAGVRATSSQTALASILAHSQLAVERVRMEVAHTLRLLLHQRLVPKADGRGRVAAFEQLVHTPQLAQLIRDDQLQQLPAVLAASKSAGMVSLDDALDELMRAGSVTAQAAAVAARRGAHFHA